MMKRVGLTLVALGVVSLASVGVMQVKHKNDNTTNTEQSQMVSLTVTVEGESKNIEGKTGLSLMEIMQENYEIQTQYDGTFISGIDDIIPDETKFLSFYINGETAMVGACDYVPSNGDKIEFKLEEIKF